MTLQYSTPTSCNPTVGQAAADDASDREDTPFGLPADRQARLAARRAFVALKMSFLYAMEGLQDKTELQSRVRQADEPEALWVLRAPVFAALAGDDPATRSRRQLLNRSLESMFPSVATPVS